MEEIIHETCPQNVLSLITHLIFNAPRPPKGRGIFDPSCIVHNN
jgi:hypothetical protein